MREYLIKSAVLHVGLILLIVLSSLSYCSRKEPENTEAAIVVDLAPLGVKTNVKAAPKREKTPPAAQPKKQEPEPEKPKDESFKEVVKKHVEKNIFDEIFKEVQKQQEEEPEPEPKPKKPVKEKQEQEDELDSLLKNLQKAPAKQATESQETENTDEKSQSVTPFDASQPMTVAEIDYIKTIIMRQIIPCWNIPAGARDAGNLKIKIDIDVERDGRLKFMGFVDEDRLAYDSFFQVAAESAQRAVLDPRCNPLRELPPMDKFEKWKELTITFDPSRLVY